VNLTARELSGRPSTLDEDATRRMAMEAASSRVRRLSSALGGLWQTALDAAAAAVAEAWRSKADASVAAESAIGATVSKGAERVRSEVDALREALGVPSLRARLAPLFSSVPLSGVQTDR